ncbi:MAG TPA: hypothetical protein VF116_07455 [Ktedonobacterales bacterium]
MSRSPARSLAWSAFALCLAAVAVALWMQALNTKLGANELASALILLLVALVGGFVAARQPRNPIGWLFCVSVLISQSGVAALEYAVHALAARPAPSGSAAIAVFGGWLRGLGWILLPTFLLMLFPDGRLPSRRWRAALWVVVATLAFYSVETVFGQGLDSVDYRLVGVRNPFAVIGADLDNTLQGVQILLFFAVIVLSTVAVIARFRRSHGIERQQLKWFTYAAAVCLLIFLGVVVGAFLNLNMPGVAFDLAIVGMPIGAGIAILRYRLYDIDVIINRTLVYGSLTMALAAVYFASVVGLQHLAGVMAGPQAGDNPLIIVVSTLLIAALFTPLRGRIQRFIDRRFYRRKYDAAKTLAAFGTSLRGEVELNALSDHLVAVVDETMRPAYVSLWLRAPEEGVSGGLRPPRQTQWGGQG